MCSTEIFHHYLWHAKFGRCICEAYCLMSYMLLKSEDAEGVMIILRVKGQAIPGWALRVPEGRGVQISRQLMARLWTLLTGHFYPAGDNPGTHFRSMLRRSQSHSAAGRIKSMKISNDTIGESNPPQPTAPLRARFVVHVEGGNKDRA